MGDREPALLSLASSRQRHLCSRACCACPVDVCAQQLLSGRTGVGILWFIIVSTWRMQAVL